MVSMRTTIVSALCMLSAACGGGGSNPPPAPTATLTVSPTSITSGGTATLTWSSANVSSCTASGAWTGARATSGSEQTGALTATSTFTLTCGSAVATATVDVTAPPTVSVSGNLLIPENVQTDSDTNDVILTPVANNDFATAQAIPNPVLIGGYVTEAGAGSDGPLRANGDVNDVYSASLIQGQVIEVTVANPDPDIDDVDLQLYTEGQALSRESVGTNRVERITVPTTGRYYIRVLAYNGASNYLLSVGQTGTTSVVRTFSTEQEFVPGELLVKMRDPHDVTATEKAAAPFALKVARATPGAYSLVRLDTESHSKLDTMRASSKLAVTHYVDELTRLKSATLHALKELSKQPDVEWVEPNWILRAQAVPNDPLYSRQRWHYEQMQLPSAWDVTTGNTNAIAAVIDTGVRPHAEFTGRLVDGYDFVGDDTDASDPGQAEQGTYFFHGTHVAGTIGAAGNNGQGVTGVAWNVSIMPVRVLGEQGSGSFDDIFQGVRYAAGLSNSSGRVPARRADVINLSLGGPNDCTQAARDIFDEVRAAGSIVVVAAGNSNTNAPFFPASCSNVISVSALGAARTRAPYSNYGSTVDVAAPGGDVSQDRDGDGYEDGIYSTHASRQGTTYQATYTYLQGTSMAAPHVAGVIALMKSVNPALTPAQVDTLLANGSLTDDIGPAGRDDLGIGLINALKAVRAASTNPPAQPARLDVQASSLNFGNITTSNDVRLSNGGSGTIAVTATNVSAPWLAVGALAVDANGLGQYRIQVNRTGLAAGTYNGWVEFRSSPTAAVRVTVLMQVSTAGSSEANAGQHYLLLLDPATGAARYQVEVLARGTSVPFNFPSVAAGQYELAVGTDANNDGLICDDGEACGQYPVYGEPTVITVSSAVTGLDIATSYHTDVAPAMVQATSDASREKTGLRRLR